MGFIEEGRQLFQDFVAPEIRALDARLSAVEKRIEALDSKTDRNQAHAEKRMDGLDAKIENARASLEARIEGVRTSLESKMERNHAEVMGTLHRMENYALLNERLTRVEAKLQGAA
jgi:hypothetical protein